MARTAVVAGTATAVSGRVSRRQAERYADRDAQIYAERERAYDQQTRHAQPPPAQPARDDVITQLQQLAELKQQGILTEEELATQKARILGS
jgi:hypothetical protein